jgi:hypothetical protein
VAYADGNPKTKKALRDRVKAGVEVGIFSPGPFDAPADGEVSIEGPWAPEPHRWYARCRVVNGVIVAVK